jgi:hypothetical protein
MAPAVHPARGGIVCQVLQIMLLASLLDTQVVNVAAVCNRSHPLVGFQGALSSREHGVGGLITIVDDCTFVAQKFTYDGQVTFSLCYCPSPSFFHETWSAGLIGYLRVVCFAILQLDSHKIRNMPDAARSGT